MKQYFIFIATLLMVIAACDAIDQVESTYLQENESIDGFRISHSMNPLSQEEAVMVARQFASMNEIRTKTNDTKTISSVYAIDGKSGIPDMFAVNYGENDGFVIVNTSKKYFPILAYSETGHYAQDRNASGLDVWLEEQKAMIAAAENLPLDSLKEVTRHWLNYEKSLYAKVPTKSGDDPLPFREAAIADWELEGYECMDLEASALYLPPTTYNLWCELAEEQSDPTYDYMESAVVLYYGANSSTQVGPYLSTKWGHYEPYNQNISPYHSAGSSIAAMAQIMRYYERPTVYNWALMSDTTATYYTKILYQTLHRDALTDTSGKTDIYNLKDAITGIQYDYRYNASVVSHSLSTAKNNVNNGKPVFMEGISSNNLKHAWVCDGRKTSTTSIYLILMVYTLDERYMQAENGGYYSASNSTDYLHMNWCEDGHGNGWFSGDNCTFSGYLNNAWTQITYSSNRKDIVNISPNN